MSCHRDAKAGIKFCQGEIILEEKLEITRPIKVIVTFLDNISNISEAESIDLNSFSLKKKISIKILDLKYP